MSHSTEKVSSWEYTASPRWFRGWLDDYSLWHRARKKGYERIETPSKTSLKRAGEVPTPGQDKSTKPGQDNHQTPEFSEVSHHGTPVCGLHFSDSISQPSTVNVAPYAAPSPSEKKTLLSQERVGQLGSPRERPSRLLPEHGSNAPNTPCHPTSQQRAWTDAIIPLSQQPPKHSLFSRFFFRHLHQHHQHHHHRNHHRHIARSEQSLDKSLAIQPQSQSRPHSQPQIPPGGEAARASAALCNQRNLELSKSRSGNNPFDDTESGIVLDLTRSFEDVVSTNNIKMGNYAEPFESLVENLLRYSRPDCRPARRDDGHYLLYA